MHNSSERCRSVYELLSDMSVLNKKSNLVTSVKCDIFQSHGLKFDTNN